jgi:hypothetical protein
MDGFFVGLLLITGVNAACATLPTFASCAHWRLHGLRRQMRGQVNQQRLARFRQRAIPKVAGVDHKGRQPAQAATVGRGCRRRRRSSAALARELESVGWARMQSSWDIKSSGEW